MRLSLPENVDLQKQGYLSNKIQLKKPLYTTESQFDQFVNGYQQNEETFNLTINQNKNNEESQSRNIKRSFFNRSCINTLNLCARNLMQIPDELQIGTLKLNSLQKIDLSMNNISDIHNICFEQLSTLKELILNDNRISELPFSEINSCKGLRIINLNNNLITILPILTKVSFLELKNNPLHLVTAELVNQPQIQFVSIDWLDYLVDYQIKQTEDKYKEYTQQYDLFKKKILQKIDYKNQQNNHYCDFHCYFNVKIATKIKQDPQLLCLSSLIIKSICKNDYFFVNYLINFQNQINYAKMTYNYKLLFQTILELNNAEALQLFKLKKSNYTDLINDDIYFESVRLCCRFSNYQMFKYLFDMRKKRKKIHTKSHLSILIQELLIKFNKEKDSDKILLELMSLYTQVSTFPITVKIPHEYNSKLYKSLSLAILEITQHQKLKNQFTLQCQPGKTTPLHFAMRSRNEQLLKQLLKQNWSVFERNKYGVSSKFTQGSTQICRKMVWRKQKQLIKQQFKKQRKPTIIEYKQQKLRQPFRSINNYIKNIVGYQSMQAQFFLYRSPKQSVDSSIANENQFLIPARKCPIKDEILPHLLVRSKQISNLIWPKHYLKKMVNYDVFTLLLSKITTHKESSLIKMLQLWKKIMETLIQVSENIDEDNDLLQYQIVQTAQWINRKKGHQQMKDMIQVQNQKTRVQSNNFWCCSNVVFQ